MKRGLEAAADALNEPLDEAASKIKQVLLYLVTFSGHLDQLWLHTALRICTSAGCAGAQQMEAALDNCGHVLFCIHAVQHGPCEHEHRSAADVPGVPLVFTDRRPCPVLLFLVCRPHSLQSCKCDRDSTSAGLIVGSFQQLLVVRAADVHGLWMAYVG